MPLEVTVVERGPVLAMTRRSRVSLSAIGATLGAAFSDVYPYLGRIGVPATEPPFVIYHSVPEGGSIDLEICAPLSRAVDPLLGWQVRELPADRFASLVHVGPYDTLELGYDALSRWVPEHGYAVSGPPRETYLDGPDTPPDRIRTRIEFPVVATGRAVPAG